jgi:hypothetical protein
MPKSSKRPKNFYLHKGAKQSDRKSGPEDFVGKFLLSIFTVLFTVVIGLAVTNQISWFVVGLVCLVGLSVLAIYQSWP